MAKADILLRAGIKFDPKDVDTKAIKNAIVQSLATTNININKVKFGRQAKDALSNAVKNLTFRVDNAKFGRSGLTGLRNQFKENAFKINNVAFTARALNSLNKQLKGTKFQVAQIEPARAGGRGRPGGAKEAAAGQRSFADSARDANNVLQEQIRGFEAFAVGTSAADRQQRNFLQTVAQGSVGLQGFGANIVKITQRFSAYLLSIKAILLAQQAFSQSLEVIFKFDAALLDLQKVLQTTPKELGEVTKGLFRVADATGRSVFEVAESFGVFRRAISDNVEALERTQTALIAVNISELNVDEATRLVTSSLNIFGAEIDNAVEALDVISVTADNAATTAAQLGRGVLRAGAAAEAVGISFKQLNAIIAATEEATKLGGSQIGSALKTIFARLASNSKALRDNANALGGNIKATDSVFETLQGLASIFPKLNKEQKASIAQIVAGKRRFTEFNAIISSFGKTNELLEKQAGSAGVALAKNEVQLSKLSTAAQELRNEFAQLIVSIAGADEGAAGINSIRAGLETLLDSVKAVPAFLNSIIEGFKEFEGVGSAIAGVFAGLVQFGLFKIGPVVLRQLVGGAKAFLGIGKQIQTSFGNITKVIEKQQLAQTGTIDKEKQLILELEREKRVRQEIATILGQTQVTGRKGKTEFSARLQGQGGGIIDRRQQTIVTRSFAALKTSTDKLKSGFRSAREAIGNSSLAATLALSAAAASASNFAQTLRKVGDNTSKFGADLLDAGAGATQLAITFGLLLGPIGAAAAGLTAFTKGLAEAIGTALANVTVSAEAVEAALTGVVTEGEAFVIAGEQGVKIFNELKTSGGQLRGEIADEIRFFRRLGNSVESNTDFLSRGLQKATTELDRLSVAVKANARGIELRKAIEGATEGIRKKVLEFDVKADFGGSLPAEFREVVGLTAEIESTFERFIAKGGEIEGSITKQTRLLSAAKELRESTSATESEIIQKNLLSTAEFSRQQKLLTQEQAKLNELNEGFGETFSRAEKLKETYTARISELGREAKAIEDSGVNLEEAVKTRERINTLSTQLVKIESDIASFTDKRQKLESNIADIRKQVGEVSKDEAKRINEIEIALKKQAASAGLISKALDDRTSKQRQANDAAQQNIGIRQEVARLSLQTGSAEAQREAQLAAIRLQGLAKVRAAQEELNRGVESLDKLAKQAAARGLKDQEEAFKKAAAAARLSTEAQVKELEREVEIAVKIKAVEVATREFQRGEQALKEFRLRQIDEVLNREREATDRRIAFIQRIGETAGGREFIRQTPELRPDPGVERQFGVIRGAIITQLNNATEVAVQGMVDKIDQLRVNGLNTFQELNKLREEEKKSIQILADVQKSGDPAKIKAAETGLRQVQEALRNITERGADDFKLLEEAQESSSQAIAAREELNATKRELALELIEEATEKVNKAENALIQERNKLPALNQKIISAQKGLASAEKQVLDATKALASANQKLADEQFKLQFNIGLAEFKARSAAGGFDSIGGAIATLQGAFNDAVSTAKASFETILEARREVLQEEVNLVQNQLSALRGLSQRAFGADPEELVKLQEAVQVAAGVQAGQIGAKQLLELPPELRSSLQGLTGAFPALQGVIDELGARLLGIDPGTFQSLEQQLIQLQTGIAETGQTQVKQAEEQVQLAQQSLEEARASKDLAEVQLDNAISAKEAQLRAVSIAGQNASIARTGFSQQVNESRKIFAQARRGAEATDKMEANIQTLQELQKSSLSNIEQQTTSLGNQLGVIKSTNVEQIKTKEAVVKLGTFINDVKTAAIDIATKVTQGNNSILGGLRDVVGALVGLRASPAAAPTAARGTLSSSEISSILSAAQKEKTAMPSGSKLMLANTSETVFTRKQAKKLGFTPRAQTHAQGGNAVVTPDLIQALATSASQMQNLNAQLQNLATRASQPQNITVQLDSERRINVTGIENLPSTIQGAVEEKLKGTPSQSEVDVMNQTVQDIINRLKEGGLEDFNNA